MKHNHYHLKAHRARRRREFWQPIKDAVAVIIIVTLLFGIILLAGIALG